MHLLICHIRVGRISLKLTITREWFWLAEYFVSIEHGIVESPLKHVVANSQLHVVKMCNYESVLVH